MGLAYSPRVLHVAFVLAESPRAQYGRFCLFISRVKLECHLLPSNLLPSNFTIKRAKGREAFSHAKKAHNLFRSLAFNNKQPFFPCCFRRFVRSLRSFVAGAAASLAPELCITAKILPKSEVRGSSSQVASHDSASSSGSSLFPPTSDEDFSSSNSPMAAKRRR